MKFPSIVLAGLLIGVAAASTQTPMQRIEHDELAFIADEHPDMVEAMRRARATLKDFLALSREPRQDTDNFVVKVAVREGRQTEYFWISDFSAKNGRFSGRIDNTPRLVKRVKENEIISFAENEIIDWMYIENGKLKGNYTACALLKQEKKRDADAVKKQLGLTCDF